MKQNRRTFLRNTALTGGAITLRGFSSKALAATAQSTPNPGSGPTASLREGFQSPPKQHRPLVRWWWPGNDVTEAELRREIGVLDQAGFGGAEIQAFLKGFPPDFLDAHSEQINGFATPSFFQHVAAAIDEARKHGMFVDYTFGSGWPFGGGDAITPELAAIELRWTRLSVGGPAKLNERLQIPSVMDGDPIHRADFLKALPADWPERLNKRTKVQAVVAMRGEAPQYVFHHDGPGQAISRPGQLEKGTAVDLTAHLDADGNLEWDVPEGTWQIFVFCSVPTGQRVNAGAGPGPQLVMDHLNAEAFAAHAKRVGDAAIPYIGQYFGNGLRAIFCDSLEVGANLFWSDDFLAEFQRRRGYDLLPYLPLLQVQNHNEPFGEFVQLPLFEMEGIGYQVREDYRQTVSELITERFYEQFNKWAHEHKLLSRTQAHGAPADVLRIYGEADIPETEDLYAEGIYDFLKMAASAANIYGRATVGSESFVWPNAAFQTTPEKMKLATDELITAGTNAIVYHGFPYLIPEFSAPGWHPFSGVWGDGNYSSHFNELNPLWPYFADLNTYITRLQYVSQMGTNVAAAALYWNAVAHGADEAPPSPKLNQAILDAGYNYDHMNPGSLLHCTVRDRMLTTTGGASYRVLVLPALDAIDLEVAGKLKEFAGGGLPIVFTGQVPSRAEGRLNNAEHTQRVQSTMQSLRGVANVYFAADIAEAVAMLRKAANPNIRFQGQALPFIQKRVGKLNTFFVRNPWDAGQHLIAGFEAEGDPELWDAWTGKTAPIANYRRKNGWVEVELDLEPMASALIVFDPDGASQAAQAAPTRRNAMRGHLIRAEELGSGGWKLTVQGLAPSGKTAVVQRNLPRLIDWSLDSDLRGLSGRGVYTTSFTAAATAAGQRLVLDLGDVKDVAEVRVNGKQAATLLLRPYVTDITDLVTPGENLLEVTITNTLFNSMVLREPRTFRPSSADNPSGLMSAGLIGPVQMKVMES